jgi:hypothetical protein
MEERKYDLKGNRAIKINANPLTFQEQLATVSKETFVYHNLLNHCEMKLRLMAIEKNIDVMEYNQLFKLKCGNFEKAFYSNMRTKFREKLYNDQIKDFSGNYEGIYNAYNPYLGKYNGDYLRSYQLFT